MTKARVRIVRFPKPALEVEVIDRVGRHTPHRNQSPGLNEIAGELLDALRFAQGDDQGYSRSYFSRLARKWLAEVLDEQRQSGSLAEKTPLVQRPDSERER